MKKVNRKEALRKGSKRYYTGKLCKHGHDSERYSLNGDCCECNHIRANASDAGKEHKNNYYLLNREEVIRKASKWNREHPLRRTEICYPCVAARRAYKLKRTPSWLTEEDKTYMRSVYALCKAVTEFTGTMHHVDHIVPLQGTQVSGLHVPLNLQILTARDNLRKGNSYD